MAQTIKQRSKSAKSMRRSADLLLKVYRSNNFLAVLPIDFQAPTLRGFLSTPAASSWRARPWPPMAEGGDFSSGRPALGHVAGDETSVSTTPARVKECFGY